ncbi:MAG: endolytic transglycosylase MltG [Gammaproteobacteria bacterium]|nr:endolytic transglycosylase MltG [Gammaproteobacteria bacterium]
MMANIIKAAILLIVLLMISLVSSFWWLERWSNTPIEQLTSQQFKVVKGDSAIKIARRLKLAGNFDTIWPVRFLLQQRPQLANVRVGTYYLSTKLTPIQLFNHLVHGQEHQYSITFVEGATFDQWLNQLSSNKHVAQQSLDIARFKQQDQIDSARDVAGYPDSWIEGQLYPDTYSFTDGTPAKDILARAANKLNYELSEAWKNRAKDLPLKTPYQALILASIIEKETGSGAERKKIASVFINRINKRMRLQTDPTVIYGVRDIYRGDITRAHLRAKNPYNTYVIKGLPPTPIAMPGRASIIAATQPATTNYLYFVAQGDGSHYFSSSLKEHNKAVRRYLRLQASDQ